ncbi:putative Iodotyrosine dehalogenase 1, partial [Operophtera brumata]
YCGLVALTSTPLNCSARLRDLMSRPATERLELLLPVGRPHEDCTGVIYVPKRLPGVSVRTFYGVPPDWTVCGSTCLSAFLAPYAIQTLCLMRHFTTKTFNLQPDKHDNKKIIVLYGLTEYHNENENDLEKRVTSMFMDVMNIDLTGYVEETIRMGKYGRRRPIRLEIISKRMTKYILNNARQFKSTGVYVSEYLSGQALEDKRRDQERRHPARLSRPNFQENTSQHNYHPIISKARESLIKPTETQKSAPQSLGIGSTSTAQTKSPNATPQKIGALIDEAKFQTICLSETWIRDSLKSLIQIDGYEFAATFCRQKYKGGGVAILTQTGLDYKELPDFGRLSVEYYVECCAVEIKRENTIIINTYRLDRGIETFFTFLNDLLVLIRKRNLMKKVVIITGDFNIDKSSMNAIPARKTPPAAPASAWDRSHHHSVTSRQFNLPVVEHHERYPREVGPPAAPASAWGAPTTTASPADVL